jgi:hypothetical protein
VNTSHSCYRLIQLTRCKQDVEWGQLLYPHMGDVHAVRVLGTIAFNSSLSLLVYYTGTCIALRVTKITGSSSDDYIHWHFGYTLSLNYNYTVLSLIYAIYSSRLHTH